jgi:DNA-binding NarL/FixJ family response regulator
VDADATVAEVTAALIHQLAPEISVRMAPSPAAATALLCAECPTALIIDPEPDEQESVALIARLRAQHPPVRILVIASRLTAALRNRLRGLGVEEVVEKPALVGGQLGAFLAAAAGASA